MRTNCAGSRASASSASVWCLRCERPAQRIIANLQVNSSAAKLIFTI
jgi:hypothetical protein